MGLGGGEGGVGFIQEGVVGCVVGHGASGYTKCGLGGAEFDEMDGRLGGKCDTMGYACFGAGGR